MVAGFLPTRRLPVELTVAARLFFEILVGLHIRDNLTPNIIMLVHRFEANRQMAGGATGHLTTLVSAAFQPT
jgi:hypothetical protein